MHRPAGGEVSTLPSTPAAERAVSRQLAPKRGETLWWGLCCHACAATRLPRAKKRRGGYPNSVSCCEISRPDRTEKSKPRAAFRSDVYARVYERERFLKFMENGRWRIGNSRFAKGDVPFESLRCATDGASSKNMKIYRLTDKFWTLASERPENPTNLNSSSTDLIAVLGKGSSRRVSFFPTRRKRFRKRESCADSVRKEGGGRIASGHRWNARARITTYMHTFPG